MVLGLNAYLNQMKSMTLEDIFGGAEASLSNLQGSALVVLIVMAVLGALWCFFGLKTVRFWSAILGFGLGFIGAYVAIYLVQPDLQSTVEMIIAVVAGIVVACFGAILYRVGIFIVAWILGAGLAFAIIKPANMVLALVSLGIGLVIALLTVVHAESVTMIITGIYGAMTLGTLVSIFIPIDAAWVQIAAIAVFTVLGIWIQFVMESGKRKRHNLKKAAEIREQHSTETEVERARAMMDNLDSIPEDEDGRKVSHAYEEYEDDSQFDDEYDIEEDDDITYIK